MLPAHKFPSALQQLRLPNDTQPFQAAIDDVTMVGGTHPQFYISGTASEP